MESLSDLLAIRGSWRIELSGLSIGRYLVLFVLPLCGFGRPDYLSGCGNYWLEIGFSGSLFVFAAVIRV